MPQEKPSTLAFADVVAASPLELHQRFLAVYDDERIIVDLQGVDTIDPDFLAELAQLRLHRRTRGLLLARLVVDSQNIRSALSAVGFERNCPIFKTLEEAIASFDGPPLFA